jgi:hypothetical protein
MNVRRSIVFMVFMTNVKEITMLNYGAHFAMFLNGCLLLVLSLKEYFAHTAVYHHIW